MSRGWLGVCCGSLGDCECLVKAFVKVVIDQAKKSCIFPLRYFPTASFQILFRDFEGCLDGVWKCLEGISGVSSWSFGEVSSMTGHTNDNEAVI